MSNSIANRIVEINSLKIKAANAEMTHKNSLAYVEECSKKLTDSILQMDETRNKYFEAKNALTSAKEALRKECIDIINQI